MSQKSKYSRTSQGPLSNKSNFGIPLQSSKYHPSIYSKKKSTLNTKICNNKFAENHIWKKRNSHNNWNKENDKNYLNYEQDNSKNNSNQYNYIQKEKRNNKPYYKKESSYLCSNENKEYFYKPKNLQKNEKKISIDYTTTQSNSSSHEESNNNNQYNSNDNNNTNITVPNENFNSNDSQTLNIDEETKIIEKNNYSNVIDFKNLNLNSNSLIKKNITINSNQIKSNSNNIIIPFNNINFQIPMFQIPPIPHTPQIQIKKNKKQKKNKNFCTSSKELGIKRSISANIGNIENDFKLNNEPYNKFNSANNELIVPIINPIIENTEILQVNVKIAKDKNVIFKLRRFDDLFLTVKLFCEINSIEEKLIKPIIIQALCTLNSIYQIYNTQLDSKNIKILQMLNNFDKETSI